MAKHEVLLPKLKQEFTINDIKDNFHLGFLSNGDKYYLAFGYCRLQNDDSVFAISESCHENACNFYLETGYATTLKDAVKYLFDEGDIQTLFKFDTRKELYTWLAE